MNISKSWSRGHQRQWNLNQNFRRFFKSSLIKITTIMFHFLFQSVAFQFTLNQIKCSLNTAQLQRNIIFPFFSFFISTHALLNSPTFKFIDKGVRWLLDFTDKIKFHVGQDFRVPSQHFLFYHWPRNQKLAEHPYVLLIFFRIE